MKMIKLLLGYCDCPCHRFNWFKYPEKRRYSTFYEKEEDNFVICCEEYYIYQERCFDEMRG